MSVFIVAPEAEDDIFQIWSYLLVEAGIDMANRIESELLREFSSLAHMSGKGHRRSDLTKANVLFHTLYHYMIIYRIGPPLQILSVLHGKRDVKHILKERL